ncbi:DUF1269 domain-containing protein [Millisia brevis]|uniref:DUF1269 domain-containing protein n=1 Tax=Millisia brevis TaxID=264148 RepID=UPI0008300B06|nr:DUF1269 domain-containing protein [Millisia brevis]
MSQPVYVYVGTYPNEEGATEDLAVVKALYKGDAIETYDAAVIVKTPDGKVEVHRHDEQTRRGAWAGAAIGALVGVLFPPALIVDAAIGAVAGGVIGHLWHHVSRSDLKEIGEYLDDGQANLIVISTEAFDNQFIDALSSNKHLIKRLDRLEAKDFERELEGAH